MSNNIFDSESDSSSSSIKHESKAVNNLFNEDSEEDETSQEDPQLPKVPLNTTEDLFGASSSDSDEPTEEVQATVETAHPQKLSSSDSSSSSSDEEEVTKIHVELPKMSTNLGDEIHFVRLPNFLSVVARPFDKQYYEDEEEDEEGILDEEGRARLRLRVENTIRWRTSFDPQSNEDRRESNARMIKYSDGSVCMQVGQEMFDVTSMPLTDFNHLFIRQGTGLQGQAVFKQKLVFRPISTNSLTHKKVMTRLQQRAAQSVSKIKLLPTVGDDPEVKRDEMWKKEDESLRALYRKERIDARNSVKQRMISKNKLSTDFLDDPNDRLSVHGQTKSKYKNIYSSDDSDEEASKKQKSQAKPMTTLDTSSSESDDDSTHSGKKKSKTRVVSSESDDDKSDGEKSESKKSDDDSEKSDSDKMSDDEEKSSAKSSDSEEEKDANNSKPTNPDIKSDDEDSSSAAEKSNNDSEEESSDESS